MNLSTVAVREDLDTQLTKILLVLGALFLIALAGRIAIPLPFTPVPLALQPHMCLLMAALLGRRLGSFSVAIFLLLGGLGLPLFSMGGAGLPVLVGPRGGYLMGYLVGTWVTGTLIERKGFSTPRLKTLAMSVGNLVIYACGLLQLSLFVGAERVILLGMVPFLVGDIFKLFIGYRILNRWSN